MCSKEGLCAVWCHFVALICRYKLLSASFSLDIMMKLDRICAPPSALRVGLAISIGELQALHHAKLCCVVAGKAVA